MFKGWSQEHVLLQSHVPAYTTEELGGERGMSQPPPPMGQRCVLKCILKNTELLYSRGSG